MANIKTFFRKFRIAVIRLLSWRTEDMSVADYIVLAPHPDDETFGCGQLISKMISSGKEITVVLFSGGGASHHGCCDLAPDEIATARLRKAEEILTELGVGKENIVSMDLPDGKLSCSIHAEDYDKIKKLAEDKKSAAILAPHPQEGWADHMAVAALAQRLAEDSGKELFYYCVWFYFSMPFRKFHLVKWGNAYFVHRPDAWQKKRAACQKYLAHYAPCGKPYAGVLPDELIGAVQHNKEIYFKCR